MRSLAISNCAMQDEVCRIIFHPVVRSCGGAYVRIIPTTTNRDRKTMCLMDDRPDVSETGNGVPTRLKNIPGAVESLWQLHEKLRFIELHGKQHSAVYIATDLNRPVHSIRGYARRNGYSFRFPKKPKPVKPKKEPKVRADKNITNFKTFPTKPDLKALKNHEFTLEAAGPDALPLSDIREGQCRWLHGDSPEWLCCGDSVNVGSSYCEKHWRIATA